MCSICLHHPCHPRCPNAPGPRAVYICSGCGSTIYEGEDVWHIFEEQFCSGCIDSFRSEAEYVDE